MRYIKYFEDIVNNNLTNKFNFIVGKRYLFDELPNEIKNDIEIQFDEFSDLQPMDYYYVANVKYIIISNKFCLNDIN